jgi:hypothetical protein
LWLPPLIVCGTCFVDFALTLIDGGHVVLVVLLQLLRMCDMRVIEHGAGRVCDAVKEEPRLRLKLH